MGDNQQVFDFSTSNIIPKIYPQNCQQSPFFSSQDVPIKLPLSLSSMPRINIQEILGSEILKDGKKNIYNCEVL